MSNIYPNITSPFHVYSFHLYNYSRMLLRDDQETPVGSRCSPLANFSSNGCKPATTVRPRVSRNCTKVAAYRIGDTAHYEMHLFHPFLICYICISICWLGITIHLPQQSGCGLRPGQGQTSRLFPWPRSFTFGR